MWKLFFSALKSESGFAPTSTPEHRTPRSDLVNLGCVCRQRGAAGTFAGWGIILGQKGGPAAQRGPFLRCLLRGGRFRPKHPESVKNASVKFRRCVWSKGMDVTAISHHYMNTLDYKHRHIQRKDWEVSGIHTEIALFFNSLVSPWFFLLKSKSITDVHCHRCISEHIHCFSSGSHLVVFQPK